MDLQHIPSYKEQLSQDTRGSYNI